MPLPIVEMIDGRRRKTAAQGVKPLSLNNIRHEVGMILADLNTRLAATERQLAQGADREKVKAAGELAFLQSQRKTLEDRLAEIDAAPEGRSETLLQWIKEESFSLSLRLNSWVSGL
jgi:hypothetical protein